MSHSLKIDTWEWKDGDQYHVPYVVHYDQGWNGPVVILRESTVLGDVEVTLPFEVMLECVGTYLRDKRVAELEKYSGRDIIHRIHSHDHLVSQ